MTILQSIKYHFDNKKFARITRQVATDCIEISRGYIVDYSKDFLIVQETDDFRVFSYLVLPVSQIKNIRFNNHDKYYDKIMVWEKEIDKISLPHKIDLSNWQTIFKSIKKIGFNMIIECEDPSIATFTIGPIINAGTKLVSLLYFNAAGYSDEKPTSINYKDISKVIFDDRYINIFSKYIRKRKNR